MLNVEFLVPSTIAMDGTTWKMAPCAGSELAVLHTAASLVDDAKVIVSCNTAHERIQDGVRYRPLEHTRSGRSGVIRVHVRDYWRNLASPGSGGILWLQDTSTEILSLNPGATPGDLALAILTFDACVFVSEWQRSEVLNAAGISSADIVSMVTYQPVPIVRSDERRVPARVIHTSHPRKALLTLLAAWPEVARRVPHAELLILGDASIYQQPIDAWDVAARVAGLERVTVVRSVPQRELLRVLATAQILAHPDTSIETGATTVLEAMFMGVVPLVSSRGCLPELCGEIGFVIPWTPDHVAFVQDVANGLVRVLESDQLAEKSDAAKQWSHTVSAPECVRRRWMDLIDGMSSERPLRGGRGLAIPGQGRLTFRPAGSVEAARWDAVASAWNGSATHSHDWVTTEHVQIGTARNLAFGVFDDATERLAAIVPVVLIQDTLVSGHPEPSGPLLVDGSTITEQRRIAHAIVAELARLADRHRCRRGLIKFAGVGALGNTSVSEGLQDALRLGAWHLHWAPLSVITPLGVEQEVSSRTRTQIRRALEVVDVKEVTGGAWRRLVESTPARVNCYDGSCGVRGYRRTRWDASSRSVAIGAAEVALAGRSAYLLSFQVSARGRELGGAKALLWRVCEDLADAGFEALEVGGGLGGRPGTAEFYRRFGAKAVPMLMAQRRFEPRWYVVR